MARPMRRLYHGTLPGNIRGDAPPPSVRTNYPKHSISSSVRTRTFRVEC